MLDTTKHINGKGQRFNSYKVAFGQIPPSATTALIRLMTIKPLGLKTLPMDGFSELAQHYMLGQAKYKDIKVEGSPVNIPNWSAGMLMQDMFIESVIRHLNAYKNGETFDSDFYAHHLRAVAWGFCNLIHMFDNYEVYKQFDDRHWAGCNANPVEVFENMVNEELITNQLTVITNFVQCSNNIEQLKYQLSYGIILCLYLIHKDIFSDDDNDYSQAEFTLDDEVIEKMNDIRKTNYGTAKMVSSE